MKMDEQDIKGLLTVLLVLAAVFVFGFSLGGTFKGSQIQTSCDNFRAYEIKGSVYDCYLRTTP